MKNSKQRIVYIKEKFIEMEGIVTETLPNANFRVKLNKDNTVNAYISGKMRKNYIKISKGDIVIVQFSHYDMANGRIIFRNNKE